MDTTTRSAARPAATHVAKRHRPSPALVWLGSLILLLAAAWQAGQALASDCPSLLQHRFNSLQTGQPQDLCQYRGQAILVVNTASKCAYTDQYSGLEELYRRYKDRGLVVLGFPSNDFGAQEPGSNKQIATFCRLTYGVEFPMFEKTQVVGAGRNALYRQLESRTNQVPRWNFHKYLIDPTGREVLSFPSNLTPDDPRLMNAIHRMLESRRTQGKTT